MAAVRPVGSASDGSAPADGGNYADQEDSDAVREILSKADPLVAARSMAEQIDETYFALGGVLSLIRKHELHERAGYGGRTGFRDYCEGELGYSLRKAQFLIDIHETTRRLGLDEGQLRRMGWGKAKELTKIARAPGGEAALVQDFDDLVDFAAGHPHGEWVEHVREKYLHPGGADGQEARVTFQLKFTGEFAEIAQRAVERAKADGQTDSVNAAFDRILTEWLATSEEVQAEPSRLPATEDELVEYARDDLGLEVRVVGPYKGGRNSRRGQRDDVRSQVAESDGTDRPSIAPAKSIGKSTGVKAADDARPVEVPTATAAPVVRPPRSTQKRDDGMAGYLTRDEAVEFLGVSVDELAQLHREERGPCRATVGDRSYYQKFDLEIVQKKLRHAEADVNGQSTAGR